MQVTTFYHEEHPHRWLLIEQSNHHDNSKTWVLKQTDEKGNLILGESSLNETYYLRALEDFQAQGWKQLLINE